MYVYARPGIYSHSRLYGRSPSSCDIIPLTMTTALGYGGGFRFHCILNLLYLYIILPIVTLKLERQWCYYYIVNRFRSIINNKTKISGGAAQVLGGMGNMYSLHFSLSSESKKFYRKFKLNLYVSLKYTRKLAISLEWFPYFVLIQKGITVV